MFESILNLFSRYVSTVGSKRRYHSSRVCAVDIAGRDSCRFCTLPYYRKLTRFSYSAEKDYVEDSKSILAEIKGEDIDLTSDRDNDEHELEIL